jgi:hypothetical protein
MNKSIASTSLVLLAAIAVGAPTFTRAEEVLSDAIMNGKPMLDVRYRFEHVDQQGRAKNAAANTVRTKIGFQTAPFYDFSALVQFENSSTIGSGRFNSTTNGQGTYPVVADPEDTDFNQAYLSYGGIPDTKIHGGRRVINLDNQRFVGSVGWRQNEQSFDSATILNSSLEDLTAQYTYAWGVQRIFGGDSAAGDWDTRSHFVNVSYGGFSLGKITGYAYLLDLDNDAALRSTRTFGVRFSGAYQMDPVKLLYTAEFAHQSDYANNPNSMGLPYIHLEPGIAYAGFTAKVGIESLGGDGSDGFQTPYATLHKFQGWADVFLTTPSTGINDYYASLGYAFDMSGVELIDSLKALAVYHRFDAEDTSADLGSEIDLLVAMKLYKRFTVSLKYANYSSDTFAADIDKLWFTVAYKY